MSAGLYVVLWRPFEGGTWHVQPFVYPYGQARDLAAKLTDQAGGDAVAHLVNLDLETAAESAGKEPHA